MPTDPTTEPVNAPSRRAFLARTAVGSAVAAAALAVPLRELLPAGAQQASPTDDPAYARLVTPLELAAVQSYQAAIDRGLTSTDWTEHLGRFRDHHSTVAEVVGAYWTDETAPAPDAARVSATGAAIAAASDEAAILTALSTLESELAAIHLGAVATISDTVTAKQATQILCTEAQQASFLGLGAGTAVGALTPAVLTPATEPAPASTTTEAPAEPTDGADAGSDTEN